ncbi:MAG: EAL domain-containing protein [Casimicrobium sp.]
MPSFPATDSLFDLLLIGAYRSTVDGHQVRTNLALARINGYDSETEAMAAMDDLSHWYVDPARRNAFLTQMQTKGYVTNFVSEVYQHKTQKRIWVSETAHVLRNAQGEIVMLEGTVEDITERLRTEQLLRESERRFRALTERAQVATTIVEVGGRVLYASAGVGSLFGVTSEALIGKNLFDNMHEDDVAQHRAELRNVTTRTNTGRESVGRYLHCDGTYRYIASVANDCSDDPAVGGIVVNWRDVTERMQDQERLKELAKTDALTGLNNRMYFEQLCEMRLAMGAASGQGFAMLFIDLNRFKLVNDAHGHRVGDAVLKEVAQRLQAIVTSEDILARLGGDEFGLMMPIQGDDEATLKASQLISAFVDPLLIFGMSFDLGASVGIALYPDDAQSFNELLAHADLAMFSAKGKGNGYSSAERFALALAESARHQLMVATDLRMAVERNELFAVYQPIIEMPDGLWRGIEALARWQHPTRGLLMPQEFITTAEEQGLIGRVGRAIAAQAIEQVGQWSRQFAAPLRLTINVSAHQLRELNFVDFIAAQLETHGLPAQRLFVELTESVLVDADIASVTTVNRLRALGVRIVLDDLGAGYSSLAYLKRLRIDLVKLDRSFIQGVPHRRVDVAIVRALSTLARSLGIHVIAEGIETIEQAEFLIAEGVVYGQGFLFERPMSPAEIEERLTTGGARISPEWTGLR